MAKKTSASIVNTSLGIRLSTHEKLCAERMKHLIKSIDELLNLHLLHPNF